MNETFDEWWEGYAGARPDESGVALAAWEAALRSLTPPPRPVFGPRSPGWGRVRAEHLRGEPTCRACGGSRLPEVHHVLPYHLYPDLELEPTNLVTLCDRPGGSCHFVFGHLWNWSDHNPLVREDAARMLGRVAGGRG